MTETPSPITARCPNCQARPGEPCTQPTDTGRRNVSWFHMARESAVGKPPSLPPWLRALVDQRLAAVRNTLGNRWSIGQPPVIMTPATEPREGATEEEFNRWDRTCDSCGTYVPPPGKFFTGHHATEWKKFQIIVSFGVCEDCKRRDEQR